MVVVCLFVCLFHLLVAAVLSLLFRRRYNNNNNRADDNDSDTGDMLMTDTTMSHDENVLPNKRDTNWNEMYKRLQQYIRLNSIGFVWNKPDAQWTEMYNHFQQIRHWVNGLQINVQITIPTNPALPKIGLRNST